MTSQSKDRDLWRYSFLALIAAALLIYLLIPNLLVADGDFSKPADRYKAENDVRLSGLQMLAGIVLAVGAYFTTRTFRLSREGQLTERFSTAVDQLGSDRLAIRLGGVSALARIARADRRQHASIIEILAAFARSRSHEKRGPSNAPPADLQAAVDAIGRRYVASDPPDLVIDLSHSDLRGVALAHGVFRGADLTASNLSSSDLRGTDLTVATLREVNFSEARLDGMRVAGADLSEANLTRAELTRTDFRGARQRGGEARWPLGVDPASLGVQTVEG